MCIYIYIYICRLLLLDVLVRDATVTLGDSERCHADLLMTLVGRSPLANVSSGCIVSCVDIRMIV